MEIVTLVRDTKKQTTTNQSLAFKKNPHHPRLLFIVIQ